MILSIIVPCYNEGESIKYTYQEIKKVLNNINIQHEIVFINDGSKDNTLQILKNIGQNDKSVKYISFSRNFGKEAGMLAGLEYITGDCVVIMDADLQHPPELIPEMIKYYEEGYDQVIAKRNRKGDNKYRTWATRLYYKLVNKLIDVELVDGVGDFRLLSRKAVDSILAMKEYNRFSKGIFSFVGYNTYYLPYEVEERNSGTSKWNFFKLFNYAIDGIVAFTT